MKSIFCGFYSTAAESIKDIWLSESTLFVFDTNCLLNLYRCEEHTREEILDVMRELKEKTWIPFQVGFEYQRNRISVIEESIVSLSKIKDELKKIYTQNIITSGKVKKHLYNSLSEEISTLQSQLKESIDIYINEKIEPRIANKKKISDHDFIRDEIDNIIGENVGAIPTQEYIDSLNELGQKRYSKKQPPGFNDDKKNEISLFKNVEFQNKYGDLYLWKEIIEKAKSENIKNVIFVCDDNKSDWCYSTDKNTYGPLAALKTEICSEAKIQEFRLITQLTFLHEAKQFLVNIQISESSLNEVKELSYADESSKNKKYHTIKDIFESYTNIKNGINREKEDDFYDGLNINEYYLKIDKIRDLLSQAKSVDFEAQENIEILDEALSSNSKFRHIYTNEIKDALIEDLKQMYSLSVIIDNSLKTETVLDNDQIISLEQNSEQLKYLIQRIRLSLVNLKRYITFVKLA